MLALGSLRLQEDVVGSLSITGRDVEAHLTDLAVDGSVAPTTQNAAFYGLQKFFTIVLKRELGEIRAIRASKGKQIPTVMSEDEVRKVAVWLRNAHQRGDAAAN
ncbi:MAG: phage integrase N-terminal SAM-like domain-containing protein [Planctomycetota bacterium]